MNSEYQPPRGTSFKHVSHSLGEGDFCVPNPSLVRLIFSHLYAWKRGPQKQPWEFSLHGERPSLVRPKRSEWPTKYHTNCSPKNLNGISKQCFGNIFCFRNASETALIAAFILACSRQRSIFWSVESHGRHHSGSAKCCCSLMYLRMEL